MRDQRGDTLIEVTIALCILGIVLVGAFMVSNKAFIAGQTAKERSQMIAAAQAQAEALISFRDSYDWATFSNQAVSGTPKGLIVRNTSADCDAYTAGVQKCFHMERQTISGKSQWVPVVGPVPDTAGLPPGNSVWIYAPEGAGSNVYNFQIVYQALPIGGGAMNRSKIFLRLVNQDALRHL